MKIMLTLLLFCAYATYLNGLVRKKTCYDTCSKEEKYVCGTDGHSYFNECYLDCDSSDKPGLKVAHGGFCGRQACKVLEQNDRINYEFISTDCKKCKCSRNPFDEPICQPLCPKPISKCEGNRELQITDEPNDERSDCICKKYNCVDKSKKEEGEKCFSATSYVRNKFGNKILMKDIKIGDKVLAVDSTGHPVYSEVIMMMHRNPNAIVDDFVKISTSNNKSITLSKYHLLPTINSEFIFSKDVKLQQSLKAFDESSNSFEIVTVASIERVSGKGYYAPLTNHGTIVVDDVYASCYASFPFHHLSHWAFSFYRIMYPYLVVSLKQVNAVNELHWYPDMLRYFTNGFNILPNSV